MSNMQLIRHNMPNNYQINEKDMEDYEQIKKPKHFFRSNSNFQPKKQVIYRTPNLYNSFMNASSPFNYYRNSFDKNSFLVYFKGGPKMQVHISKNSGDPNNKEVIYSNMRKPCGCLYKSYVTKVKPNFFPLEKCKYNMDNTNIYKEKIKYYIKINNSSKNRMPRAVNLKKYSGLMDNKNLRMQSARIPPNYGRDSLNNDQRYNSCYEEEKNITKKDKLFRKSCANFRPNFDKTFHKIQIFNHCKPYLVDQFQDFPD